jgi:hypothetical protein
MAKHTKTWKLGEVCQGGVITVIVDKKEIFIIGKEWDNSAGYKKSSNQSQAKEFTSKAIQTGDREAHTKCFMFLTDLTTAYWANEIIKWIETHVKFQKNIW